MSLFRDNDLKPHKFYIEARERERERRHVYMSVCCNNIADICHFGFNNVKFCYMAQQLNEKPKEKKQKIPC